MSLFVLLLLIMAFLDPWLNVGTVILNQTGLTIRNRTSTVKIPWEDVESMSVAQFLEGESRLRPLLTLLVGSEANRRYVRVRLRRSYRAKLLPGSSGTRAFGLPSLIKSMPLYVEEPETVIKAAESYLHGIG